MNILITGAAGFIGSHLVVHCIKQGHHVGKIDTRNYVDNTIINKLSGEEVFRMDGFYIDIAKDPNELMQCFSWFKPDVCFHLAAYASEGRSNHIRSFIHHNNTVGTANVINACVNYKCKLVFTSSVAVYSGTPPFDETMLPNPIDEYGLSKYMSERSIQIAAETQGLEYCIIRPRNVYGPGQNIFDRSRNLFGIWCYNALNNLPCLIYGDGRNSRTFTYIDDIIPCFYKAKDVKNEIINLGSHWPYSLNEAWRIFESVAGYKNGHPAVRYVESRHEVAEATCRIDKSIELLGFPQHEKVTALTDGLKEMWAWAKTVPMRELDKMPELEVTVNAHSSLK